MTTRSLIVWIATVLCITPLVGKAHHGEEDIPSSSGQPAASIAPAQPSRILEALGNLGIGSSISGQQEFLDPDVAYVLSADVRGPSTLSIRFDIADEYYLYRDKFRFAVSQPPDVAVGSVEMPRGVEKVDEFFGRMEVFYDHVEVAIPVKREFGAPTTIALDIGYQGCADAGLCYPPMTKTMELLLPASFDTQGGSERRSYVEPAFQASIGELPEQDRIAQALMTGSTAFVLLTFFGFGLLLAFTPCMFPMMPILSSIIVGYGANLTTIKAFSLSLTYVLAMAVTYTAAGVMAGLFGGNLQALFQEAWILIMFSVVFVLLAASMFGLYELQVPVSWQKKLTHMSNRQQGGTYLGVAIMGFLSALIVGPCVAAPLAGALIYIGQTGDALLGGLALFALSLGMGAPLLALGTSAAKLLPKAGPWMKAVRAAFGVLLLAVAIYLLERIIPGWVTMLLWAGLLILTAVYVGALDRLSSGATNCRRLGKGAGLAMMAYGVLLMVGAAGGGEDPLRPLRGVTLIGVDSEELRPLRFQRVKGLEGLEAQLQTASAQGRPVMLDFYADWCVSCKELERYTFADPGVQQALADAVLLQADVTENDALDQALLRHLGLFGPPAILFFGADGQEKARSRVIGFVDAEKFRDHVELTLGPSQTAGRLRNAGV